MTETASYSPPLPPSTFREHLRATVKLGVPLVIMQVTQMLVNVTDTLMVGWLGVEELAAGVLAFQTLFVVLIFALGISAALMPLVAGAMAKGDTQAVRRSTRMCLWVLLIVVCLFVLPLGFGEQILLALGQKPELAAMAQTYIEIARWSLIPAFLFTGLRNFLTSIEQTRAILWITIAMAVLNAFLNYALIFGNFGAPRLELEGAAIATCIANSAALIALALYVQFSRVARPYALFQRFWRPEWPAFFEVFKLGLPIALTILAEVGLFTGVSLMIGWLGAVPLAAHGIALQLASITFMVPLGLSQAAAVRVGNAVGRGDRNAIGLAARAAMALGVGFACLAALIFLLFPRPLVSLYLEADGPQVTEVLATATALLFMAALFQIFDTMQVTSLANLRGLKDTNAPFTIAAISYWPIGLGTAYVLGFALGFGAVGIWAGLVAGLAVASAWLTWRFSRREQLGLIPAA
ncbi:MAG: MATE family efflux transporter [Pseudomonadota bacterium]